MHNISSFLQRGSSHKACKFACSHLVPNSSEEVSWERFPISSSVKVTSSSYIAINTSLLSWTSVVATVGVGFHVDVTAVIELSKVVLGATLTVFYW